MFIKRNCEKIRKVGGSYSFLVFLGLFGVLGNFSFWCDSFSNKTALVTFVHLKKMKSVFLELASLCCPHNVRTTVT